MNNKFDELTKSMAQSVTRRGALKKFGVGLAGMALACFGMGQIALAQTSIVCDSAGDPRFAGVLRGPAVPPWLDIARADVSDDSAGNILFTLTLHGPVPAVPTENGAAGGGQLWWGWRILDDLASPFVVRDGCVKAPGQYIPAGYLLDLIWHERTSSFQARLLDDTSCAQSDVPFFFSTDRTQVTMVVAKSLFTNPLLIPDPNEFQFWAATTIWKSDSTGNNSFFNFDYAPDLHDGGLVAVWWSAGNNAEYNCP